MTILAQAADTWMQLTPERAAIAFAFAVVGWLTWYFRRHQLRTDARVARLETSLDSHIQFAAGVVGASLAGPTVASAVIHDLHDQHKPSDASGTYRPIVHRPRQQKE